MKPGPTSADLPAWHLARGQATRWSARRIGLLAMQAGTTLSLAALPISLSLMNIGIAIAGAGALLARAPLWATPGFRWGLAFTACGVASEASGWIAEGTAPRNLNLLYSWFAFPLALVAWSDEGVRRRAAQALAVTLGVAALLAIAQFLIGYDLGRRPLRLSADGGRFGPVSGFLNYNLTYGAMACVVGAALFGRSTFPGRGWRALGRIAALIAILLSLARLAMIGATAGLVAFLTFAGGRWRWAALPSAGMAALVAALLLHAFAPEKLDALLDGRDGRRHIWAVSAGMIADHPWAGLGGQKRFQAEYARRWPAEVGSREDLVIREPTVNHAHSSFLTIAAQNGLPALVCHLGWLAALAIALYRRRTSHHEAMASGTAVLGAWLAAGLFNNLAGQGETAYAGYLALALALAPAMRDDADAMTP